MSDFPAVHSTVYCEDNESFGEVISVTKDYVVVEYSTLPGEPCHVYDVTNWWTFINVVN